MIHLSLWEARLLGICAISALIWCAVWLLDLRRERRQ